MARRRRKKRTSATRNTASLLALALPAPLQRLASSPVGPLLMFVGLPAMLVAGLLQIDWHNGAPQLKLNQQKASEIGQSVQDRLGNLPQHLPAEQWQQAARDTWNSHLQGTAPAYYPGQPPSAAAGGSSWPGMPRPNGNYANDTYANGNYANGSYTNGDYANSNYANSGAAGGGAPPTTPAHTNAGQPSGLVNPHTRAPFPSTKPAGYISTSTAATNANRQPAENQTWGAQPAQDPQSYPTSPQQQYAQQQYAQQQHYQPQQYQPQQYPQQQQYQLPALPAQQSW